MHHMNISNIQQTPLYVYRYKSSNHLNLSLLLLGLGLNLLLQFTVHLALKLVGTTNGNVLGTEVTEQVLKDVLNHPAATVVEDHQHGQSHLELIGEGNKTELLVQLGNEFSGARERHTRRGNETPVHALVLTD